MSCKAGVKVRLPASCLSDEILNHGPVFSDALKPEPLPVEPSGAPRHKTINPLVTGYSTGPHSAVGNVSGYRCVSDCRSRGREFDPGPVPYFRAD